MNIELLNEPSTELTVQARAAIALSSTKTRQDLIAMAAKSVHLVEIKNKAARDEIHGAAMALVSARTAISKTGKAARDDATKFSKAVIAEEASLIAITEPEEKRLLALRDGWDEVVAAEKAAKEAAEKARVIAITERIAGIRQYVELAASCRTSERIQLLQDKLAELVIEGFEEFQEEAELAGKQAGAKVEELLTAKLEQEAEQARIKTEQAEAAAKLAAERAEFAAQQAAAKIEADKMAALIAERNAAFEAETKRQNDVLAAERAAQAAEQQRAFKEAKDAQDKLDAEHMAERKRFAEEKAAFEAQVANQAAEAKRVAEQAEEARIAALPVAVIEAAHQVNQSEEVAEPVFALESELVPEFAEPSDADVMWEAIAAVSSTFNMTTEHATARLAAVQWTI